MLQAELSDTSFCFRNNSFSGHKFGVLSVFLLCFLFHYSHRRLNLALENECLF